MMPVMFRFLLLLVLASSAQAREYVIAGRTYNWPADFVVLPSLSLALGQML